MLKISVLKSIRVRLLVVVLKLVVELPRAPLQEPTQVEQDLFRLLSGVEHLLVPRVVK